MAEVTASMVAELRAKTGAGMMDCKKALSEAQGNMEVAIDILRKKGLSAAAKKSGRIAAEGLIAAAGQGNRGAVAEINSETDFVGRSDEFRAFAHEVALQIAASSPLFIKEEDIPESTLEHEKEIAIARAREEGKPDAIIPKIVEGTINKYKDDVVLMRQPYIRDDSLTIEKLLNQNVAAMGENIIIRRFARYALGEQSAHESEAEE